MKTRFKIALILAVSMAAGLGYLFALKSEECRSFKEHAATVQKQLEAQQRIASRSLARELAALTDVGRLKAENRGLRYELELAKVAPARCSDAEDRVLNLPEDSTKWHTSLFVQPDYEKRSNELAAVRLFDTQSWAVDLKARTHFHLVKVNDPAARPYFQFVCQTPCLIIQEANGQIRYRECNPDLWQANHGLKFQINKTMRRQRHGNQPLCPGPACPMPDKEIPPADEVPVSPDQADKPEPAASSGVNPMVAAGIIAAAFFGSLFLFDVGGAASRITRAGRRIG